MTDDIGSDNVTVYFVSLLVDDNGAAISRDNT